ncbi:myeloid-derived growth factor-like [Diadema setosum]|uniref:myeloid-derived growth factor-like n=1 Tax=Diadema setosum TaxID=31175 RepID=UPI003B3BBE5F
MLYCITDYCYVSEKAKKMDCKVMFSGLIYLMVLHFVRSESIAFDVKPGGNPHSFEHGLGDFNCQFSYVAQGGTNEKWELQIESDRNDFICTVLRPQGTSYLFFQEFRLQVSGAVIHSAEVVANNDAPLKPGEYAMDETQVHSVPNVFKSQLARVTVEASRQNAEL